MSTLPFIDVDDASREASQKKIEAYLKGETPLEEVMHGFATWSAFFAAVQAAAVSYDAATTDTSGNPYLKRIQALLALALRRDSGYALAGREHMMKVGFNSKLRHHLDVYMNSALQTP